MRFALVFALAVVACSTSSTGTTVPPPSADAAGREILQSYCARIVECGSPKISSTDQCAEDRLVALDANGRCSADDVRNCADYLSILKCDLIANEIEPRFITWRDTVASQPCKRC